MIALACFLFALLAFVGVICFWLDQRRIGGLFSQETYKKAMTVSFCVFVVTIVFGIIASAQGWP